mgnify:CR=1 FL=1
MAVLEVRNLKKSFDKDTVVLRGVDFSLEKGETVAIIGSSGSGKTTLLRCLNFLTVPDEGQIVVNGETLFDDVDPDTQKESEIRRKRLHFGLVFQNFNLFPQYTAKQNVMLASELLAKERPDYKAQKKQIHAQIAAHAEELLTQVGLREKMELYPHQLSGGQQQRVAIARALAHKKYRETQYLVLRRADLGARPRADRRGSEGHPLAFRAAYDDDRRHARNGLRPGRGEPRDLHGRRRDCRAGPGARRDRKPAGRAHEAVSRPLPGESISPALSGILYARIP